MSGQRLCWPPVHRGHSVASEEKQRRHNSTHGLCTGKPGAELGSLCVLSSAEYRNSGHAASTKRSEMHVMHPL